MVLKAKQGSSFGKNFFVLYERAFGFLSPYPGIPTSQFTEDFFIRGGVPVFSLPALKPKEIKDSVIPSDLFSSNLPALIFLLPICIKPFKNVPHGRLKIEGGSFKGKKITFHDPCYLGRANDEYEAPRALLEKLDVSLKEMRRCKKNGLCCGAGGSQMFKEAEKGTAEINHVRADEAMETGAEIVVAGCPFCNTMLTDGVKNREKEDQVQVLDLAEMIALAEDL